MIIQLVYSGILGIMSWGLVIGTMNSGVWNITLGLKGGLMTEITQSGYYDAETVDGVWEIWLFDDVYGAEHAYLIKRVEFNALANSLAA